jgi:serine/threonine-protein kinase
VAIKELFPHGSGRRGKSVIPSPTLDGADFAAAREKFLEEARVLARFTHPGIVAVYDAFLENNTAYMVMRYLKGHSLEALLSERGSPLPEAEAVDYVARAGEALEVVHRAGMLHRDLKPGNMILTDEGEVVLIDFGTVRAFAGGSTRRMTTLVTPGYAPLEQYGQHARFGPFTDVYALGATLYHLVTGQVPTQATDRAVGAELAPARALNPALSPEVSEAIAWAMEQRVDQRPQSVAEFLAALRPRHVAQPPRSERPRPGPVPPRSDPTPLPQARRADAYDVEVEGPRLHWPDRCACCLDPPDGELRVQHTGSDVPLFLFQETRGWNVPYCAPCLRHVGASVAAQGSRAGGCAPLGAGLVAAIAAGSYTGSVVEGGLLGLVVWLAARGFSRFRAGRQRHALRTLLKPSCVAAGPAAAYNGWFGDVHSFTFLNRDFAQLFRQHNAAQLVGQ